jgi:hypothetical protein
MKQWYPIGRGHRDKGSKVSALFVRAAAFNATKCSACTALDLEHKFGLMYSPLVERSMLDFPLFPAGEFHEQKKVVNIYVLGAAADVETDSHPSGNIQLFSHLYVI